MYAIIVGEHTDWLSVQVWTEDALAADVAVITINDGIHNQYFLVSRWMEVTLP